MLRPYQVEAVNAILDRFRAGDRATLLVLPTGTGKTIIFSEIIRRGVAVGRSILVLAHRDELIQQAVDKLISAGIEPAVEKAERRARDERVIVASVQSLRGERLRRFPSDRFGLIVADEAHHTVSASWSAVFDHFASAKILGVTATPDRLDGVGLGRVFQSVAHSYAMADAIRDGWLCPLTARRVFVDELDISKVKTRAGDLDEGELAKVFETEKSLHSVAVPLVELAGDRRTLLFAVRVAHARALAEVINRYKPGYAVASAGDDPIELRREIVAQFRRGEIGCLCNCMLFTEGFDVPEISCVAIARPTKSRALYNQQVGRGSRVAPGKQNLLILDFVGNTGKHRLVTPIDLLGKDDLEDDVKEEAERLRLQYPEEDLLKLLDMAEETIAEQRKRKKVEATAVVRFHTVDVDPFLSVRRGLPGQTEPATEKQRAVLEKAGMKPPVELSKGHASAIIEALFERREKGLCTYKQAKRLRVYGIDGKEMGFDEASRLIVQIKQHGWTMPYHLREALARGVLPAAERQSRRSNG